MPTIEFGNQTLTIDHAYSYARVSSKQQTADQGGEGIDRQDRLSQEWSARYGVPLDHTLRDLGRSGSKGHHLRKGAALGAFLEAVRAGQIKPHSALLVESFSRLSRLHIDDAMVLFLDVVRAGVTLITLQDQSAYTRASIRGSHGEMHKVTALLQAARTEAEMKAFYVRKSWEPRRQRVTRQCPAWLIIVDGEYVARPEAVAIIIYIFEQCRDGISLDRIARNLNNAGVPLFGGRKRSTKGWYFSYLQKLITHRTVRGETEEHRYEEGGKRIATGKINKPYPAIVSETLWQEANGALANRRMAGGLRTGRKGEDFTNLFSGMAICVCGEPMLIRVKGSRKNYTYYQCRAAQRGLCEHRRYVSYRPLEATILSQFGEIAYGLDKPEPTNVVSRVMEQIAVARHEAAEIETEHGRLAKAIGKGTAPLGTRRLAELESAHADKLAEIANLEKTLNATMTAKPASEEIETVRSLIMNLAKLPPADRYAARARINAGLQRLVGAIVFHPGGRVDVRLDKPPYGNGPLRQIKLVDAVSEGAIRLTTAADVLLALKDGHPVAVAPPE